MLLVLGERWTSPSQEVEAMSTHQNVPVGVHFEQVAVHRVKHQTSDEKQEDQSETMFTYQVCL